MAEATIEFKPDTEYLEQVVRAISTHLGALADDLAKLRTGRAAPAVLEMPRRLYDAMVAHCRAEHPVEACGILAGPRSGDVPDRIITMVNADRSREAYRFDPDQQLAVFQDMQDNGERPVVIYHSHTASQAYPSKLDIQHAAVPDAHWVIVSTRPKAPLDVRSFRIVNGEVVEEPLVVT